MIGFTLLAAHMVGDYIAQTNWMAARKLSDWRVRTLHVACYTACFAPTVWWFGASWWFLAAVAIPHWVVDSRRWASPEPWGPKPILVDQSLHAACLAVAGVLFL